MSVLEKFTNLGFKRKQNNKDYIEYLKIDKEWIGEYTSKDSEKHISIKFCKRDNSIELDETIYSLNVEGKKYHFKSSFSIDEAILDAINEQITKLKSNRK